MVGFCTLPSRPTKVSKPASAATSASPLASMVSVGPDLDTTLLGPGHDAFDLVAVPQDVDDSCMKQHLGARFRKQMVPYFAPDQRVVRQRIGFAVADRIRDAALDLHHIDKAIGKSENDLFGCGRSSHRSRRTSRTPFPKGRPPRRRRRNHIFPQAGHERPPWRRYRPRQGRPPLRRRSGHRLSGSASAARR